MNLYPFTFRPILKERVWGGRRLRDLYGKSLPPNVPIGESWEICDRPGDVSVITNGRWAGKDLRWLMEHHPAELLGTARAQSGRFPLLIKILDAREKLSLQVHPPAEAASRLGGEPKTEMWYVADAQPGAELYVGLRAGTTPQEFDRRTREGTVDESFHRVPVRAGDAMFLPSGRVHAIGAGLVIFEVQQNSDTTYRVFDWNRVGLDGKPRQLHVAESLASIDFQDFEPGLVAAAEGQTGALLRRRLVSHSLFAAEVVSASQPESLRFLEPRLRVLGLAQGTAEVAADAQVVRLAMGDFCLVPASLPLVELHLEAGTTCLVAEAG